MTTTHRSKPEILPELSRFKRYTLEEVAPMLHITRHYLWQCVRAARDEKARKRFKISIATLRSLPVQGWFQQGRGWFIRNDDLLRQIA